MYIFHALVMHCTCHLLHTPLLPLSCIGLYLVFFILACRVYLMLCSILFRLRFELHFLIHLAPLMHHLHIFFPFPSFLLIHLSIRDKKGREYCHFYMTHVHTFRGINFTLCTFVGGESHRGDAYTKGEKTLC